MIVDIYTSLFLLCLITVNLVDLSGFITTVKHWIWKWVFKGKREYRDFDFRPFECSYCMTHHLCVIYALIVGAFTLEVYLYILILAFLTPIFKDILTLIKDVMTKIIDELYRVLNI